MLLIYIIVLEISENFHFYFFFPPFFTESFKSNFSHQVVIKKYRMKNKEKQKKSIDMK